MANFFTPDPSFTDLMILLKKAVSLVMFCNKILIFGPKKKRSNFRFSLWTCQFPACALSCDRFHISVLAPT